MGADTWAASSGADAKDVADDDIARPGDECRGELKALRKHDINVVTSRNDVAYAKSQTESWHYWGIGKATEFAREAHAGLDATRAMPKGDQAH